MRWAGRKTRSTPYLILPAIVSLKLMWDLPLHLVRKFEVGFGYLELSVDLIHGNAVVHQAEEADGLGRFEQLLDDFCSAVVEV